MITLNWHLNDQTVRTNLRNRIDGDLKVVGKQNGTGRGRPRLLLARV